MVKVREKAAALVIERDHPVRVPASHPQPPVDGRCQTCGQWAPYLTIDWPATLWKCSACSRPPDDLIGVPLI